MSKVELIRVTKRYGNDEEAVKEVVLDIKENEVFSLLGPSGCGKTTTLRMIAGLQEPTSGEILIDGKVVYSSTKNIFLSPAKRRIGLVFQSYALWPHMTVYENVAFGLRNQKPPLGEKKVHEIAMDTLERLRIAEYVKRYPAEISGGQQQRVSFARMLAIEPSLLLLDEPLSNLDAKLRLEMRSEIKRLPDQTGATIIYVTHDQQEAMAISTRIGVMNRGELLQVSTPEGLYYHPINLFVAGFIGNPRINLVPGEVVASATKPGEVEVVVGQKVRIPQAALDLPPANRNNLPKQVVLGVRPEDLVVSNGPGTEIPGDAWAMGSYAVYASLPMAGETLLELHFSGIIVMAKCPPQVSYAPDQAVTLHSRRQFDVFDASSGRRLSSWI